MNRGEASGDVDVFDLNIIPQTTAAKSAAGTRGNKETLAKRRLERIQQFLIASLEQEDAWRGCVGPIVCDLLQMCQRLKSSIDEELQQAGSFVDVLAGLEPAFHTYLKMVRQIERLAKLDYRIRGIGEEKPPAAR